MWSISASNPEGTGFMAVLIFLTLVAVLVYGLRVYSQSQNRTSLDTSDYTCFCGLVSDEQVLDTYFGKTYQRSSRY